jgi:siroheme synthase (precorrin-2 oxidase/ferrochelatase)
VDAVGQGKTAEHRAESLLGRICRLYTASDERYKTEYGSAIRQFENALIEGRERQDAHILAPSNMKLPARPSRKLAASATAARVPTPNMK